MTGLDRLKEIVKSTNDFVISRCTALEIEIAGICDQIEREHLREVDDISGRDSDILAWVEEHGGIEGLKSMLHEGEKAKESVRRQQAHIESIQRTLSERGKRIQEMQQTLNEALPAKKWVEARGGVEELEKRLMPEGMEWPCFEDGEPVRFGDVVSDGYETGRVYYVTFDTVNPVIIGFTDETPDQDPGTWLEVSVNDGERVKRPERKDSRPDGCCHPGSYECDELAFRNQNSGEDVYADKCLVPELRRLRESGIRTLGSCCGHGTTRPNIVVAPECEGAMRRQGYEGRRNKFGVLEFAAKSSCPAPKVLDADGAEIRVGDTVYYVDGREQRVNTVARLTDNGCVQFGTINEAGYVTYCEAACIQPNLLTHRAPVLAADGLPLREGETVYVCVDYPYSADIVKGEAVSVRSAYGSNDAEVVDRKGDVWFVDADQLTHKPFDSWERLEDDATRPPRDYCGMLLHWAIIPEQNDGHYIEGMASDLVRRAKALAGVSE